jgi:UDP-N-acetyl-D-mannosaminuronic acid dehydrogenase
MQRKNSPTVCVMGLGYIGLPTATLIASSGMKVIGVDVNKKVLATLSKGEIHIVEPDLEGLFAKVIHDGSLKVQPKPAKADVFMIAVPTPINDDKSPNIDYVLSAVKTIAPLLKKGDLVIIESTSPVGTTHAAAKLLKKERKDLTFPQGPDDAHDVHLAYCPERVLPGRIITELVYNDRTIGGMTAHCAEAARRFSQRFVRGECIATEAKVAELVKLSENAYRDVNIAFANELAAVCEHQGIRARDVIALANRHPRVNILTPGPGVGGHCIPVDPWFIIHGAPKQAKLMKQARLINDARPAAIVKQVQAMRKSAGPKVAVLGLAYKPDVDDLRESPAMEIAELLADKGAPLYIAEPHIDALPKSLKAKHITFCDALTAISEADIVLILVKHRSFGYISKDALEGKEVIDTVGLW